MEQAKTEFNTEPLSHYEHTAMWMAYRYAIGRHTAAASRFCDEMIKAVYYRLTDKQKEVAVLDLRREINMCLANEFAFELDPHIQPDYFDPFKALYDFADNKQVMEIGLLKYLEEYRVIAKEVNKNGKYMFQTEEPIYKGQKKYWHNFDDLLSWAHMADALDQNKHYIATIEKNGITYENVEVFETYARTWGEKLIKIYASIEDYIKEPSTFIYYKQEEIKEIKQLQS